MYGTTCFGCSGSGKMIVKPTVKLIKEAKARIAAGALDAYFERNRRINTARKMLPSMVAEAETFYNIIANDYSKAYKAKWMDHYGDVEAAAFMKLVSPFQTEANEIFWRKIKDIQRMTTEAFRGEQLVDAEVAASFIQAGIEVLKDLAARYEAAKAA
jgi:hypothetical protein